MVPPGGKKGAFDGELELVVNRNQILSLCSCATSIYLRRIYDSVKFVLFLKKKKKKEKQHRSLCFWVEEFLDKNLNFSLTKRISFWLFFFVFTIFFFSFLTKWILDDQYVTVKLYFTVQFRSSATSTLERNCDPSNYVHCNSATTTILRMLIRERRKKRRKNMWKQNF